MKFERVIALFITVIIFAVLLWQYRDCADSCTPDDFDFSDPKACYCIAPDGHLYAPEN